MFILWEGERYRVLLHENDDIWVISYDAPSAPQRMDAAQFEMAERIEAPPEYLERLEKPKRTTAQHERYRLIAPVVENTAYIWDKKARRKKFGEIAAKEKTTVRRLQKLYNMYLATGILTREKPRAHQARTEYDWAIRKFYLSAKKYSLRMAYDMMILSHYTNQGGTVDREIPTWDSFRQYYNRYWAGKAAQRHIARDGLTSFQRNQRMAYGSAMLWRDKIGSYQMDETQADIYLVSQFDRSRIIGRPNIYLAVDTATQLIAGVYVGLDAGEEAVVACIANATMDKQEYCRSLGIEMEPEQWPSAGIPREVITDKGGEFLGGRMDELCVRYGIERHALPPFRPDEKGIVEKMFDLIQSSYKPALRGKGVIEEDCYERWAADYRSEAVLTLREFTQIVIRCILYLNSGRILEQVAPGSPRTPAALWNWYLKRGKSSLMEADAEGVYRHSLPRAKAKFTRKGLSFQRMYYIPAERAGLAAGDAVTVAYDPRDASNVFLVRGTAEFIPCSLAPASAKYSGCTAEELKLLHEEERKAKAELRRAETESRVAMQKTIHDIAACAGTRAMAKGRTADIAKNRREERERRL